MKKLFFASILSLSLFVTGCTTLTGCTSSSNKLTPEQEQEQLEKNDTYVPHWAN